jgi:hypothetical protein
VERAIRGLDSGIGRKVFILSDDEGGDQGIRTGPSFMA